MVYDGLHCDNVIFEGQTESSKRINLLFDYVSRHYHAITNLTGAMAKMYACSACNKGCDRRVSHLFDRTCSDCMPSHPCASVGVRITCGECNRHFRNRSCYDNHKIPQQVGSEKKGSTVCKQKKCCGKCAALITERKRHECNKRWCEKCGESRENGHLCFMRTLRNVLPTSDTVLFVFYDFETTLDTKYSYSATVQVPNLVCLQQFCSKCEKVQDISIDCEQCGRRKHTFWDDPVGDLLTYLCKSRPWCNKIVVIAQNAKAFDLHFILDRAIFLMWKPKLILNVLKIICVEHLTFIDSISFMPCSLRKLPEAFRLTVTKSW